MRPVRMDERVAFDPPNPTDDGYGGETPGWGAPYECPAHFLVLRGGEAVQAGRLAGRQTLVVTIRANATSRSIVGTWRMRDLANGRIYNIKTVEQHRDSRAWLEILVEGGAEA